MDFAFSEEQQMLREQARGFLADKLPLERVAELAEGDRELDDVAWGQLAELGWLGLSVPEDAGGAGYGFLEEAVLFEELGYGLYPGPYFSTVALALPALAASPPAIERIVGGDSPATLAWAESGGPYGLDDLSSVGTKAERANGAWTVTGEKVLVPDLRPGTLTVVVAQSADGPGLFLLEAEDENAAPTSTMDATRRYGTLSLSRHGADQIAAGDEAVALLERVRLRALAAASLEAVGISQRALEMALEHAKDRKQFDKPIGAYQAVSHQIADAYVETELARSVAYWAAWCVAEDHEDASTAVAAAKSCAGEAAVGACERSIQVHGGIGFTWEHILHRLYKRAQWIDAFAGFGGTHRHVISDRLFG